MSLATSSGDRWLTAGSAAHAARHDVEAISIAPNGIRTLHSTADTTNGRSAHCGALPFFARQRLAEVFGRWANISLWSCILGPL